jgi:hypothetical protein
LLAHKVATHVFVALCSHQVTHPIYSDCLLIVSNLEGDDAACKAVYPLETSVVVDVGDGALPEEFGETTDVFEVYERGKPEKRFVFYASSSEQKVKYVQALAAGIRYQIRMSSMTVCTLCGENFSDDNALIEHASSCTTSSVAAVKDGKARTSPVAKRRPSIPIELPSNVSSTATPVAVPPLSPSKVSFNRPTAPPQAPLVRSSASPGAPATAVPPLRKVETPTDGLVPSEDFSTPEEVVQWLRGDPDRRKAAELVRKDSRTLTATDRKQWETLREMARQEKRKKANVVLGNRSPRRAPPSLRATGQGSPPSSARASEAPPTQTLPSPTTSPREGAEDGGEGFVVYSATISPRTEGPTFGEFEL